MKKHPTHTGSRHDGRDMHTNGVAGMVENDGRPQSQEAYQEQAPRSVFRDPSRQDVERRAFEIYQASGSQPGRCDENWFQAERELMQGHW